VLFSFPDTVPDRTEFLLGQTDINPARAIADQLGKMAALGVTIAVIACNTAHASPIFDVLLRLLQEMRIDIRLVHLVNETVAHICNQLPQVRRVGVLGTHGTYQSNLYGQALADAGLEPVIPDSIMRETVQAAIYTPGFGIKACADHVSDEARRRVHSAISHLHDLGAETVILGCTELPLAVGEDQFRKLSILDPARIVAKKLIQIVDLD